MEVYAAVLVEPKRPLRIERLGLPALKAGQVLVEIAYGGLCGTQLLEIRGAKGPDPYLPHVLGHEGVGTVLDVGKQVTKVRAGDRVVLSWIQGCGMDAEPAQYSSALGRVNAGKVSTFMTHAIVSENRVTPVAQWVPVKEAAIMGCAMLTAMGMVDRALGVRSGSTLALFGLGGIGLSTAIMARARGAIVFGVDVRETKLHHAQALGVQHVVNAAKEDPIARIRALTSDQGVDYAIEAAGDKQAMEAALGVTRTNGGVCLLAGNVPRGMTLQVDPYDLIRGKRLCGTWGGGAEPDADLSKLVEVYPIISEQMSRVITHVFPLHEINCAVVCASEGLAGRVLLHTVH
ncbi:MAG: acetoin dehydrogenase [Nitrospirae bacterium]|nr:MAG: acetoin dehydrogenase [Nitrospirota bacterium]